MRIVTLVPNKSVTNDLENVLRKIEAWHQGPVAGFRIMYRDSDGCWDRAHCDGERTHGSS
ncbi:MAG: hypothetical protein WB586_20355 [Chthoniobacterales bacterium]